MSPLLALVPALSLTQAASNAPASAEPPHRGAQATVSATVEILETVTNDPRHTPRDRQRQVTRGQDRVTVEYF